MGTIDFESIYNDVKDAVVSIVVSAYKDYKNAAISDATNYLNEAKGKIKEYTLQLVNEEISEDEFKFNIAGLKELCEMNALKECGVTEIALDKTKSDIINAVISTIIDKI
jgi:hypothetical protein